MSFIAWDRGSRLKSTLNNPHPPCLQPLREVSFKQEEAHLLSTPPRNVAALITPDLTQSAGNGTWRQVEHATQADGLMSDVRSIPAGDPASVKRGHPGRNITCQRSVTSVTPSLSLQFNHAAFLFERSD